MWGGGGGERERNPRNQKKKPAEANSLFCENSLSCKEGEEVEGAKGSRNSPLPKGHYGRGGIDRDID